MTTCERDDQCPRGYACQESLCVSADTATDAAATDRGPGDRLAAVDGALASDAGSDATHGDRGVDATADVVSGSDRRPDSTGSDLVPGRDATRDGPGPDRGPGDAAANDRWRADAAPGDAGAIDTAVADAAARDSAAHDAVTGDRAGWYGLGGSALENGEASSPISHGYVWADEPALALDSAANPWIAWNGCHAACTSKVYLRYWDGAGWRELGGSASGLGISSESGSAERPRLALDQTGRPVVAWNVWFGWYNYLRRWDGETWAELGGSASGTGISAGIPTSSNPALALDINGEPVVAWQGEPVQNNYEIYVRRWGTGNSTWTSIAGSDNGYGISVTNSLSRFPVIAIGSNNLPVVAWAETVNSDFYVYLRRWSSSSWVELADSASGTGVGGASGSKVALAIGNDNQPIVAWSQGADIVLLRWNGSAWSPPGSGWGSRIVNSAGGSNTEPALAVDGNGRPIVAWQSSASGQYEIYLRRWDGTSWQEIDGSQTGGGISRTPGNSTAPSLAVGARICVAWTERLADSESEIRLRCHD